MTLDTMVPIPAAGSDALTAPEARGLACYEFVPSRGTRLLYALLHGVARASSGL